MKKYDYDLIVIGGGAAGFVSSKLAAGLGKKAAMIEKNRLGGECTLHGCIPSKTLINTSRLAYQIRNIKKYGLVVDSLPDINTGDVMSHVRSVVEKVYSGHTPEIFQKLGIDVFFGNPKFIDNHQLELNGNMVSSKEFLIATGSSPAIPAIEGIETMPYLTNDTIFDIGRLPGSMMILGGGPIGAEMASALSHLGVDISLVHKHETILNREDRELADILSTRFKDEGIKLFTGYTPSKFFKEDGKLVLTMQNGKEQQQIKADSVLIAVGRKANVEGLALENAGIEYTMKGIKTDSMLRTTASNIYACGDVVGPYQFSHMAEYQAVIAVQNALLPIRRKVNYKNAAWCIFTDPEIAHAGMTEEEARDMHGDKIKVYKYKYKDIDRGKTDISETGMSKFICDRKGRLIGAHILGARAGELIHEAQIAKSLGIPFYKLYSVIHIYPTFTDIVKHPAKLCYMDKLQNNFFLKVLRRFVKK